MTALGGAGKRVIEVDVVVVGGGCWRDFADDWSGMEDSGGTVVPRDVTAGGCAGDDTDKGVVNEEVTAGVVLTSTLSFFFFFFFFSPPSFL